MARLKDYYVNEVAPALMNKFSYKSVMQVPKLDKIVVNVGAGEARENSKVIDAICKDLAQIFLGTPICHTFAQPSSRIGGSEAALFPPCIT